MQQAPPARLQSLSPPLILLELQLLLSLARHTAAQPTVLENHAPRVPHHSAMQYTARGKQGVRLMGGGPQGRCDHFHRLPYYRYCCPQTSHGRSYATLPAYLHDTGTLLSPFLPGPRRACGLGLLVGLSEEAGGRRGVSTGRTGGSLGLLGAGLLDPRSRNLATQWGFSSLCVCYTSSGKYSPAGWAPRRQYNRIYNSSTVPPRRRQYNNYGTCWRYTMNHHTLHILT